MRFLMLKGIPASFYVVSLTFTNPTVVSEIALAKFRKNAPIHKICYIDCGATTGIGAAIKTLKVKICSQAIGFGLVGFSNQMRSKRVKKQFLIEG